LPLIPRRASFVRLLGFGGCCRRQIGAPGISSAFPFPVSLLFPHLNVFAFVSCRLAASVVHGELIGAANQTEIAGFRDFDFVCLPSDNQTGLARRSPQSFLIASFVVAIGAFVGNTMASLE